MDRRRFILSAPLALAACGTNQITSEPEAVARAFYVHPGPKTLTLMTMKNVGSDNGAHTGMMINASQRILWDPAGTFGHDLIPRLYDVHFGVTPRIAEFFISYHSRETYYTLIQEVNVPPETAEMALRLVLANGPTPKAFCAVHTSRMLNQLPGFETIRRTFSPSNLSDDFAKLPGVRSRTHRENDSADKSVAAAQIDAALRQSQ